MVADAGATAESARSSVEPRVTPIVLPARSAGALIDTSFGPYTLLGNGAYACVKSITLARSAFLPRLEMTTSTLPVVRNGIRLVLVTGTSSALTPSSLATRLAMSMS